MGLLSSGTPLTWEESKEHIEHVKTEGLKQFAHIYRTKEGLRGNVLKWGDEVEYSVLKLCGDVNDPNRTVKISLRSPEIIQALKLVEAHGRAHGLSEADMCS